MQPTIVRRQGVAAGPGREALPVEIRGSLFYGVTHATMNVTLATVLHTHHFETMRDGKGIEHGRCVKCARRFILDHASQVIAVSEDGQPLPEPKNTRWVYDPCPGAPD